MGEIIGWLIMGLIISGLARLIMPGLDQGHPYGGPSPTMIQRLMMPGHDLMGCLMTALLGIAGSIAGGFIGQLIFGKVRSEGYFTPSKSWILSLVGRSCCY